LREAVADGGDIGDASNRGAHGLTNSRFTKNFADPNLILLPAIPLLPPLVSVDAGDWDLSLPHD